MWPKVKQYGTYVLIALAGLGAIAIYLLIKSWTEKTDPKPDDDEEQFKAVITEIGAKMTEAKHQATVEVAVAHGAEAEVKESLENIKTNQNPVVRRRLLADLYERVKA